MTQIAQHFFGLMKSDSFRLCSHEAGRQLRQKSSPLTEGSVLLCRSTNLRLNYLIDQTGAPQGAPSSLSDCAPA